MQLIDKKDNLLSIDKELNNEQFCNEEKIKSNVKDIETDRNDTIIEEIVKRNYKEGRKSPIRHMVKAKPDCISKLGKKFSRRSFSRGKIYNLDEDGVSVDIDTDTDVDFNIID